jgi:hypothetical protein
MVPPGATAVGFAESLIEKGATTVTFAAVAVPPPGPETTVFPITVPIVAVGDTVAVILNVVVFPVKYRVPPLVSEQVTVAVVGVQDQFPDAVPVITKLAFVMLTGNVCVVCAGFAREGVKFRVAVKTCV